jgi:hypothetical protein
MNIVITHISDVPTSMPPVNFKRKRFGLVWMLRLHSPPGNKQERIRYELKLHWKIFFFILAHYTVYIKVDFEEYLLLGYDAV